jgi:hypothetical protein
MAPDFYLTNMGIRNPVLLFCGRLFYRMAPWIARNKILAVLAREVVSTH